MWPGLRNCRRADVCIVTMVYIVGLTILHVFCSKDEHFFIDQLGFELI